MLRRNIFGRFRSPCLARAVVTVLAIWIPLTLVAACVPIPRDPTAIQKIPTDTSTDRVTPNAPLTDRDVLVALYHSTDGDNWLRSDNWLTDAPIGSWYGVVADSNDRVIELDLSENGLIGSIPPKLGRLTELEWLSLSDNRLSGSIPPELGNLINLESLDLYNNRLSGTVPPELGNLINLESLSFYSNLLRGTIPPELGGSLNWNGWIFQTIGCVGQYRQSWACSLSWCG